MTYIDFFDRNPLQNVCTVLAGLPNEVIFIGSDRKQMTEGIKRYIHVFSARKYKPNISFYTIGGMNTEEIAELLSTIVKAKKDCSFGLTGGEEKALVAMGIASERCRMEGIHVQTHRINLRNNTICDCDGDGNLSPVAPPRLTVSELITLFGGKASGGNVPANDIAQFTAVAERLWQVCKKAPAEWNKLSALLASFSSADSTDDNLTIEAELSRLPHIKVAEADELLSGSTMKRLLNEQLILDFSRTDKKVAFRLPNVTVKKGLIKAGNALEYKIFLTALSAKDKNGEPFYSDVKTGISLDWNENPYPDVQNEIDVLLMKEAIPVFISCKNGNVDTEELYKLNAVAERFGGHYGRKILILDGGREPQQTGNTFFMRAAEMRIRIIDNVHKMTDAELLHTVKTLWQS